MLQHNSSQQILTIIIKIFKKFTRKSRPLYTVINRYGCLKYFLNVANFPRKCATAVSHLCTSGKLLALFVSFSLSSLFTADKQGIL